MDFGERDPSSIPVRAGMPLATMEAVKSCLSTFGTVSTVPEKPYAARVAIAPSKENIQAVGKARLYQDERGYYLEFRRRSGDGTLGGAGVNGTPDALHAHNPRVARLAKVSRNQNQSGPR